MFYLCCCVFYTLYKKTAGLVTRRLALRRLAIECRRAYRRQDFSDIHRRVGSERAQLVGKSRPPRRDFQTKAESREFRVTLEDFKVVPIILVAREERYHRHVGVSTRVNHANFHERGLQTGVHVVLSFSGDDSETRIPSFLERLATHSVVFARNKKRGSGNFTLLLWWCNRRRDIVVNGKRMLEAPPIYVLDANDVLAVGEFPA